jgi:hypothetical protein
MNHLLCLLSFDKKRGNVEYHRLLNLLDSDVYHPNDTDVKEKWMDEGADNLSRPRTNLTKAGSVGEFLQSVACPSEIKNFKRLISALETFERESGMKISSNADGDFLIPLGPDLKASLKFFMP